MEYKINLENLDDPYVYAQFDELPKDIIIELLIRQLKRLNKISEYVVELKQNASDEIALDKILKIIKKGE